MHGVRKQKLLYTAHRRCHSEVKSSKVTVTEQRKAQMQSCIFKFRQSIYRYLGHVQLRRHGGRAIFDAPRPV